MVTIHGGAIGEEEEDDDDDDDDEEEEEDTDVRGGASTPGVACCGVLFFGLEGWNNFSGKDLIDRSSPVQARRRVTTSGFVMSGASIRNN